MKEQKERNECAIKTSIGGQALMEGIMMRGPKRTAIAVRNPKGEIVVETSETKGLKRPKICRLPIIRGVFGYIDSMVTGYKSLMRSAEICGLDDVVEESPRKKKKRLAREAAEQKEQTENENPEKNVPEGTVASVIEPTAEAETSSAEAKAEAAPAETPEQNTDSEKAADGNLPEKEEKKLPSWVMTLTVVILVVFSLALAVSVFILVPMLLFNLFVKLLPAATETGSAALDSLIKSAFEGIVKIFLLVGYMALISLTKDIRRTFQFHGAEHKTIFCYEAGKELTIENVREQRRFHPRCGTSFLILMVLVSIFISFFIDPIAIAISGEVLPTALRFVVRFLLVPLIVGIGYELIKFAGRHENFITRVISAPGMWLQHITVLEPTDDMIECAILAVKEVIPEDGSDRI